MRTVSGACAATFAIGLFFIFVWAPHPWGREGFDNYHQLALAVARGRPFPTMEVPWGYAYFLAAFYRVFGDHPVVPLVAQAALNSFVPLLTFLLAREWFERRTAIVAAVLVGLFSFNTIYASTQSSDAVCTVLFLLAILAFVRAEAWPRFAAAGALTGIAAQFRPNLILVPALLAAYAVWRTRSQRSLRHAGVLLGSAALVLAPWVVRNYRLTRTILPTSVHGGVQLWYGTLQVGPYLNSRAYNPRTDFDMPVFDYTSLEDVPLVVTAAAKGCAPGSPMAVSLTYWTDRDGTRRTVPAAADDSGTWTFDVRAPHHDAVVYYYVETSWPDGARVDTPRSGASAPFVYFVTGDHLGDADVHADLVDIFDLLRAARARVWHESIPAADRLRAAGVQADDPADIASLLARSNSDPNRHAAALTGVDAEPDAVVLQFADGSSIGVPKRWSGRITDVAFSGTTAEVLMHAQVRVAALRDGALPPATSGPAGCREVENIAVNGVFYRSEPQMMRRYSALAWDNIRRAPGSFAAASIYRAFRLFVVYGTEDVHTVQQFRGSRRVYLAGTVASAIYFVLLVAGVAVAWRSGRDIALPLLLVLYVPATIAPVLTNMRYTVTVQPIVFMFVASALTAIRDRAGSPAAPGPAPARAGTGRARRL